MIWGILILLSAAVFAEAREADRTAAQLERDFAATFIAGRRKGYVPRPCGFDMDRNGAIGEAPDRRVGDGKTRDPDADGVNEDILYVDADAGSDQAGDGSPGKPLKTIQQALDLADGPEDGAEDIVCISGTFHEALVMRKGGVPGHYTRDGFQFPKNPTMIIGWDKDGDGVYPPYDQDDTAVLDGQRTLAWAIANQDKLSHIEIAHLTIRNYGYKEKIGGALKLFRWGTGSQSHVYIHDVEMHAINKAEKDASSKIVINFWGGPMTDVAIINNLVDEYSSYFCRGAPPDRAGRFRFQNNTLRMYGMRGGSFVTGWKLWGHHRTVEILDNVLDCNAAAWRPLGHVSGVGVCQGTQDWMIRGNVFLDLGITLQPFAKGFPFERRLDNILIGRNIFRSTYSGWAWPRIGVHIQGYKDAPAHQSVEDVVIANNFFCGPAGWGAAVLCTACNGGGPQHGTIAIAGNTMLGPFAKARAAIAIEAAQLGAYRHQRFVIKNNLIANAGDGLNVAVDYAPQRLIADGNVYDADAGFRWNNRKHWESVALAAWKAATRQDVHSRRGTPLFVDPAAGDLHLAQKDSIARGAGVDISQTVPVDFDGQPRSPKRPVAGADVPNGKHP